MAELAHPARIRDLLLTNAAFPQPAFGFGQRSMTAMFAFVVAFAGGRREVVRAVRSARR